jgi:hypothetical protein
MLLSHVFLKVSPKMTELDQVIAAAFASQGKQDDANKVYLTLLRTPLFIPVKKTDPTLNHIDEQEPFSPLFAKIDDNYFMLVFDTLERLTQWAGDQFSEIDYVEISGKDAVAGISEKAFLCLNMGTEFYKEFSPDEVKRLKTIVARIEQLRP